MLKFLADRVNRLAVLITGIEVAVLVEWLRRAVAGLPSAAGFLFGGILVEEVVRFRGIKGRLPNLRELVIIAVGVAVETVAWIIPVAFRLDPAQTFGVLFVGLDLEHAIIGYATTGKFDLRSVIDFSAVEAAGGTIWLVAPGIGTVVVLAITSVLEHVQGIRQGLGLRN